MNTWVLCFRRRKDLLVDDAVPVALVGRAQRAGLLRPLRGPANPADRCGQRRKTRLVEVGRQPDSSRPLVLHGLTPASSGLPQNVVLLPAGQSRLSGHAEPLLPRVAVYLRALSRPPCRGLLFQHRLSGRQPSQRHPVGTAAHIVEAGAVAELHAGGLAAVLAADAES